jgi:hypothetical protein
MVRAFGAVPVSFNDMAPRDVVRIFKVGSDITCSHGMKVTSESAKGTADATQNVLLIFLSLALYSATFARGDHSIPAL